MKRDAFFRTVLSAAMVTVAVAAQAAEPQPGVKPAEGSGGATMTSPAVPAIPPTSVVGMDVVNAKGKKIGEVSRIVGDQVVVSVGGFLGIGSHDVALNWKQFDMMGSGKKAKLRTDISEDELKRMQEYEPPAPPDQSRYAR
jgi:hypothetical protein